MINTEFIRNNILTFGLELVSEKAILELLDHLEAVESECLEQARLNGMGSEREAALMAKLEATERERDECNRRRLEAADHFAAQTALMKEKYDALRAKIEATEKQEPIAQTVRGVAEWVSNGDGTYSLGGCLEAVAPLTDHANELRRYSRKIGHPAGDVPSVMLAAADEIERLRTESAGLVDDMNLLRDNNTALRARIEAMERQERRPSHE